MELHDGVCNSLVRAVLALERLGARPGLAGDAQLAGAVSAVREGLAEARGLLGVLGSAAEAWDAFVAQLRWESSVACERAGIAIDFAIAAGAAPPVPPAVAHAVRRIASEAITNAIRHGGPTRVALAMSARGGELRVRVQDDGRGNGATAHTGHGLASIVRRARRLGGDATFGNGGSGGFVLEAWVRHETRDPVGI